MKKTHGGKRPGAGKPKGVKWASTIAKDVAREQIRQIITSAAPALVAAQIANAQGIKYLVVRDKRTGKFLRVSEGAAAKLDPDEEIIEVWEKDPSVQAFTDLMNRALDKPKEQEQELKLTGEANLIAALIAGRKRAAAARQA